MDRDLRDWLRDLVEPRGSPDTLDHPDELSKEGAEYLAQVAADGTLKSALTELATGEPELAG